MIGNEVASILLTFTNIVFKTYRFEFADYCQRPEMVRPTYPCGSKQTAEPVDEQIDHVLEQIKILR